MGNLSIRAKIRLALGILGGGYVALLLLVQWTSSQTQMHMKIASGSLFPAALSSQEAEAGFQKVVQHYADAVLMQDKNALAQADESARGVGASLLSAQENTAFNPIRQQDVKSLLATFEDISSRSKSVYSGLLEAKGNMSDATQQAVAGLARDNKQTAASLHDLGTNLSKDFQAQLDAVTAWSHRQQTLGLILFIVTAACASFLGLMVERQVSGPLQRLTARLKDIAEGEGDLTQRIPISSEDEIGEVSHWCNTFIEKLHDIISRLAENTVKLGEASNELSKTSASAVSGADTQREQTTQVATAMQEMSSTVTEIADTSSKAAETAKTAESSARDGGRVVERTVDTMRDIANSVGGSAKKIEQLGKSSERIGNIIGVIDDIADQTNLLALNAAIEAARAGEQGRGLPWWQMKSASSPNALRLQPKRSPT